MAEIDFMVVSAANGFVVVASYLANLYTLAVLVLGASFTWLARLEMDELDRQSVKPNLGRGA